MREATNILIERNASHEIRISFRDEEAVLSLKANYISQYLKELITRKDTVMVIEMTGIHFIDHEIIDTLNILYRLGKKYHSKLILKYVEPEVYEMFDLARKYYVFDITNVELVNVP